MITIDEAKITIITAFELKLSGAEFMARLGPERVAAACNGIGPECWSQKARDTLDKWLWLLRPAADIHDCRFAFDNDGSDAKFRAANDELERNGIICADAEYRWFNPLRYVWRHRARVMADMCREYGWSAWRDAYIDSISGGCRERGHERHTLSSFG